ERYIYDVSEGKSTNPHNVAQALLLLHRYPRSSRAGTGRRGTRVCPSGLVCSPPSETGCFSPPTIPVHVDLGHCLPPC
ncbi:hypothetical protein DFH09DRAFT_1362704, partial [Mycena vulgaris]